MQDLKKILDEQLAQHVSHFATKAEMSDLQASMMTLSSRSDAAERQLKSLLELQSPHAQELANATSQKAGAHLGDEPLAASRDMELENTAQKLQALPDQPESSHSRTRETQEALQSSMEDMRERLEAGNARLIAMERQVADLLAASEQNSHATANQDHLEHALGDLKSIIQELQHQLEAGGVRMTATEGHIAELQGACQQATERSRANCAMVESCAQQIAALQDLVSGLQTAQQVGLLSLLNVRFHFCVCDCNRMISLFKNPGTDIGIT